MLELDHVIVAVEDLDAAGARFEERYGLTAIEGGRHRGMGTANRIVPLGASYVELMAIVDEEEAADSAFAQLVRAAGTDGDRLGALCLRTDDIASVAARLGTPAPEMGRHRPDGREVRWKLAGLEQTLADPGLPFFIQWADFDADYPGAAPAEHRSGASGLAWVEIALDETALRERVGEAGVDIRVVSGEPRGVRAAGITTPDGEIVLG